MSKRKIYILLSLLVLSFFLSLYFTFIIGKSLEQIIVNYATVETERVASVILNDVVSLDDTSFNSSFFEISRNKDGDIELINFDSSITNKLLKEVNDKAMKRLSDLEKGNASDLELSDSLKGTRLTYLDDGIVCDIPLGVLFHNSLIVNLTASIPIRFSFIGTVSSNLVTNVKEYGFNNALIEVGLEVTIKEKITMPHSTKSIPIKTKVNLVTQIVQGGVPEYYNGSFSANSSVFSTEL